MSSQEEDAGARSAGRAARPQRLHDRHPRPRSSASRRCPRRRARASSSRPPIAANNGGLEFSQYADLVRRHLTALGYQRGASADDATLIVSLDYGVDDGRERVVSYPDPFGYGFGYGSRLLAGAFGYLGARSPIYWGWHDPCSGAAGGYDTHSYTVYTSSLDLDIRRTADGQSLFEGLAQARSRNNELPLLVPNLVEAMFTGFPGNSGETVRITVAPSREQASSGY